ncbi:hypothetical protein [Bacillus mycoides]|uniref:hypothetical protein n=1 Tax=Bacillus mycoides TaxID=1405 RepID=UPI003CC7F806
MPLPPFSPPISYYHTYPTPTLPPNFLQPQLDYFPPHTYKPLHKQPTFHTKSI